MRRAGIAGWLAGVALLAGCTIPIASTRPAPPPPLGEIDHVDRGEIVTVNDTKIDLRNPNHQGLTTAAPGVPVGPVDIPVALRIGGEARHEIPAEEITVRLPSGKMVLVVQPLSNPPFAPGERVKILYERPSQITGQSRMRVERE